jgi:DNA-binding response OmpR family regulator
MNVTLCATAECGMERLADITFDLVVLDINLPGMDGFEFLQQIRKDNSLPVIIVSARRADEDLILGLGIGADEFITKPFSPRVLAARVRALLRRVSLTPKIKTICFADFFMDPDAYLLMKNQKRIPLTSKEFELLRFLILKAGKVFSASQLYTDVWGKKYGDLATVAIHIQRLRKKIEKDPANPELILNVYGAGYYFNKHMLIKQNGDHSL